MTKEEKAKEICSCDKCGFRKTDESICKNCYTYTRVIEGMTWLKVQQRKRDREEVDIITTQFEMELKELLRIIKNSCKKKGYTDLSNIIDVERSVADFKIRMQLMKKGCV